ncbi:MAG: hypothetical protein MPJ24_10795 [Pirellulaceae bacterium]|nr:hypothetical protein [Pirellulaceae bacterium]
MAKLRYSIQTLLVGILVLSIGLAFYGREQYFLYQQERTFREIIAKYEKEDVAIYRSGESDKDQTLHISIHATEVDSLVIDLPPIDYTGAVKRLWIVFEGSTITSAPIVEIKGVSNLKKLREVQIDFEDHNLESASRVLASLYENKTVDSLIYHSYTGSPYLTKALSKQDQKVIQSLKNLTDLQVQIGHEDTDIFQGLGHLRRLTIRGGSLGDEHLDLLKGLPNLVYLELTLGEGLNSTKITKEGVEKLKKMCPNLEVVTHSLY